MTDWEKAIAHWLPEMWTPGRKCKHGDLRHCDACGLFDCSTKSHELPCPRPSRDLGFRLLEVMGEYDDEQTRKGEALIEPELWRAEGKWHCRTNEWMETQTSKDLVEAIVKAAAALAKKEQP